MRKFKRKPKIGTVLRIKKQLDMPFAYILRDNTWESVTISAEQIVVYMGSYKQIGELKNTFRDWVAILHPVHGPCVIIYEFLEQI